MAIPLRGRGPVRPHDDQGFFGPDSVTWKVWSYPTSLTVGFQRAVVIEELDPALVASVDQTEAVRLRPRTRYDRTLRYFSLVAFGDSDSAVRAADVLVKVHAKGVGIEPLSGNPYDANDPHSQLWIHLTAWHSILYAYERYGPGRLPAEEEARYWEECAVAAELQTCDPADVPRTREGIRAYFEDMRPKLAGSEVAQEMMAHLLDARVMLPPSPRIFAPMEWAMTRVLRAATIATMPHWMRRMGGLRQPRIVDIAVRPVIRGTFWGVSRNARLQVFLLGRLSPSTVPVAAPVILGVPAARRETVTPARARERAGVLRPTESYAQFKALVAERRASREAGIAESEPLLGAVR